MTSASHTTGNTMRLGWAFVALGGLGVLAMGLRLHGDGFRRMATAPPIVAPTLALPAPSVWHSAPRVGLRGVQPGPRRTALLRVERAEDSQKSSYAHWLSVMEYARHYRLGLGLSHQIYRIARAQHIDPELAFRLVRVESNFVANAVSYAGAVGLTQLMPGTARYFKPGVTPEELMDPETNLRIGFRYLRVLVREFDGNLRNALLTYNRGPTAVYAALLMGEDPGNGYDRIVLRGYAGRGVTD